MSVKISALPTGDPIDGSELLPTVQAGTTIKITMDDTKNYIASMPVSGFDNSGGDVTLENWGLQDAASTCTSLNNILLDNAANYTGKVMYIRNSTDANMTIDSGNLIELDGSAVGTLGQNRSIIAVSNGVDWLVVGSYGL